MFSLIKNFRTRGERFVLPDRSAVTMTTPFMRAYTELLVRTCHRRGAHAIGGMAAFVPDRRDATATEVAFEKVRADTEREANDGFDGSWVAQWLHHGTRLSDGRRITRPLVEAIFDEEYPRWQQERPSATHLDQARELFIDAALSPDYPSFTTIGAYQRYLVTAN